jgi:hypothetical protein
MADEQMHPADVPEEKRGEDSGEQPGGKIVRTALITGETFEVRAVRYAVVDGLAVVEGDIVLSRDEDVQRRTAELREKAAQSAAGVGDGVLEGDAVDLTKFVGVSPTAVVVPWQGRRWPGGVVPFVLDDSLTPTARTAITEAISTPHFFPYRTYETADGDEWYDESHTTPADDVYEDYLTACEESRQVFAEVTADLARIVPNPEFGDTDVRFILEHVIEEYARHVGHADLLREAIDGATGE